MDFSPVDKIKYKRLLLQTYKAFSEFCNENGIHYFAAGGTMIGAVRHQGFIPWDDDIDVYMKRSNYDKFIALRNQLIDTEYEIIDPSNDGYYCAMAKFSHRNSTIWEFQSIPFVYGAYIDVFVLDYEDGTWEDVTKKRLEYAKKVDFFFVCSNKHSLRGIINHISRGEIKKASWFIIQKCVLSHFRSVLKKNILQLSNHARGRWLIAYTGTSGKKDIFRAEWFDENIRYPFEDAFIEVPSGYDSFLKAMFGDYMTLPSVEEQRSHHALFYYNLERRITDDEIVKFQLEC